MMNALTIGDRIEIGLDAGLSFDDACVFALFIYERFPTAESTYVAEWADRWVAGKAWAKADYDSRAVMIDLASRYRREVVRAGMPADR